MSPGQQSPVAKWLNMRYLATSHNTLYTPDTSIASYADALWARHAIFLDTSTYRKNNVHANANWRGMNAGSFFANLSTNIKGISDSRLAGKKLVS